MEQDSALILKKVYQQGKNISIEKAKEMLAQSNLIGKLLANPAQKPDTFVGLRAFEWRLLELCEIPFAHTLEKTKKWLDFLVQRSIVKEGFSLTGDREGLLACHNALITTILMKLSYPDKEKIDAGIQWILNYQNIERGKECRWIGSDLSTRFNGCMKETPCFYGVVKSMIALSEYKKRYYGFPELNIKLNEGLEYILKHRVYKKLSKDQPIEPSIIENFYPYTYKTNIIEILSLLKENGLFTDSRCNEAKDILRKKQHPDGFWRTDISFMKNVWVDFDPPKKPALWISFIINNLFEI
jgi:hypothetical protein